jgi:hypothetical protein
LRFGQFDENFLVSNTTIIIAVLDKSCIRRYSREQLAREKPIGGMLSVARFGGMEMHAPGDGLVATKMRAEVEAFIACNVAPSELEGIGFVEEDEDRPLEPKYYYSNSSLGANALGKSRVMRQAMLQPRTTGYFSVELRHEHKPKMLSKGKYMVTVSGNTNISQ